MDELAEQRDVAQARLDQQVREVYMHSGPSQLDGYRRIMNPRSQALAQYAGVGSISVARELVVAAGQQSAQAQELLTQSAQVRAELRAQAVDVLAAQDRARDLLLQAEAAAARQQAQAAQAAQQAALTQVRERLDVVSATVTVALTPAQTTRSRAAARAQEPVLALLERTGAGLPAGYHPTGTVLTGPASWYGPGFVGSPTASGAPYDPERLTCAHKELPLGTVLHVSANGRSVNCLVTDRGPFVGDRILDMSRAGSRMLGYSGVAQVTVEVLAADPGVT
jgi:rare lipoprotein A